MIVDLDLGLFLASTKWPFTTFSFGAEAVAFETEALDPETEAARQYVNKSHICNVNVDLYSA